MATFDHLLEKSRSFMRRAAAFSAIAAIIFVIGQHALEAARMSDAMSGILDPNLQIMSMRSAVGAVAVLRLLALLTIAAVIGRGKSGRALVFLAAVIVVASFALTGHTAASSSRWALAPLLVIHVAIVSFWFGSLLPLHAATTRERPELAGAIVAAFSTIATRLVPLVFAAGLLMSLFLVPNLHALRLPYGTSLLSKAAGFAILMGLAAFNKWRLVPAIASGAHAAKRAFRRSLLAEYVLIATVLSVTATMTTLYSPDQ